MGLEDGLGWQPGDDEQLAELFYRHVDPSDVADRDPAALVGCVRNLLANGAVRAADKSVVVASNPSLAGQGWSLGRTVINIITEDRPFLVDSVASELTRLEVGIHMLTHPVVAVTRDAAGRLLDISAPATGDPDSPA
ncbi:MAG: hypothetical protein WCF12_08770, partial [Propionicimonas sp.]